MTRIEERVAVLEADKEIRELVARYGFCADLGWSDQFVELYTDDAVVDVWYGRFLPIAREPEVFRGKDAIRRFITTDAHKSMEGSCHHHVTGNLVIDVRGDRAEAHGYSFVLLQEKAGLVVKSIAFRRWVFVRLADEWRIDAIVVRPVGSDGVLDAFADMYRPEQLGNIATGDDPPGRHPSPTP